jgi:hypothetical protein
MKMWIARSFLPANAALTTLRASIFSAFGTGEFLVWWQRWGWGHVSGLEYVGFVVFLSPLEQALRLKFGWGSCEGSRSRRGRYSELEFVLGGKRFTREYLDSRPIVLVGGPSGAHWSKFLFLFTDLIMRLDEICSRWKFFQWAFILISSIPYVHYLLYQVRFTCLYLHVIGSTIPSSLLVCIATSFFANLKT